MSCRYVRMSWGQPWLAPQGSQGDPGLVVRTLQDIFGAIAATPGRDTVVRLSMLEVHNEVG